MDTLTPTPGPGIARGVPHLIGFRLGIADLEDPTSLVELATLPGGALVLGTYVDVVEGFDDGVMAPDINLALTFDAVGDAFASAILLTAGADVLGSRNLIPLEAGALVVRVLDGPAPVFAGTVSGDTEPYSAGVVDVWLLVAELNG